MRRIGLVLGAGGSVGHAFHAGVLAGIAGRDRLGRTRRRRDRRHVGGFGRRRVAARQQSHRPTSPARRDRHAAVAGRPKADGPGRRGSRGTCRRSRRGRRGARFPAMSAPSAIVRGALQPWSRPLRRASRPPRCPKVAFRPSWSRRACGRCSTVGPSSRCGSTPSRWTRGRRVTFGRDASLPTDVATAVAASCAIPAFFAPVTIDGVRYVDGGVHSPTNADLVAGLAFDLVVISSPMSIARGELARSRPINPRAAWLASRTRSRGRAVRRGGTPVLTFQPTDADLAVMGLNAMDASRVGRRHDARLASRRAGAWRGRTHETERRCLTSRGSPSLSSSRHPRLDAGAEHRDVGRGVVVAGDAVVQHAVVGEDRDADAHAARERHERERLEHRPAARVAAASAGPERWSSPC